MSTRLSAFILSILFFTAMCGGTVSNIQLPETMPDDFYVEYSYCCGMTPEQVLFQCSAKECTYSHTFSVGEKKESPPSILSPSLDELESLYQTIKKHRFFSFETEHLNHVVYDYPTARIKVEAAGQSLTISVSATEGLKKRYSEDYKVIYDHIQAIIIDHHSETSDN